VSLAGEEREGSVLGHSSKPGDNDIHRLVVMTVRAGGILSSLRFFWGKKGAPTGLC